MARSSHRQIPPPPSSPMHPVGGALVGATHGDNKRHACLRAYFMNVLLQDPRVVTLFDQWGLQTGHYREADAVARASDELARVAGVSHWTELVDQDQAPDASEPFTVVGAMLGALRADMPEAAVPALEQFVSALDRLWVFDQSRSPSSSAFVRDTLGLRWSWLAYELIDSFFRCVQSRAFGVVETRGFTVVYQSPPAPPVEVFQTVPGETVAEIRARVSSWFSQTWRTLDEAERRAMGRRAKQDTEYLKNWAEWFYRLRLKRPPETIAALAREHQEARTARNENIAFTTARRSVQLGVREAERLLSLGQYEIRRKKSLSSPSPNSPKAIGEDPAPPPRKLIRQNSSK